jgi:hypothetical protein
MHNLLKTKVDYALADLQSAKMQVAAAGLNMSRLSADLRGFQLSMHLLMEQSALSAMHKRLGTLVTANQNMLNGFV